MTHTITATATATTTATSHFFIYLMLKAALLSHSLLLSLYIGLNVERASQCIINALVDSLAGTRLHLTRTNVHGHVISPRTDIVEKVLSKMGGWGSQSTGE